MITSHLPAEYLWSTSTTREDVSARAKTYRETIEEFARGYWAAPRRFRMEPGDDSRTFTMQGGTGRRYRLITIKSPHGWPMYAVVVVAEGAE